MIVFALCYEVEPYITSYEVPYKIACIFSSLPKLATYWNSAQRIYENNKARIASGTLDQYAGEPALYGDIVGKPCFIVSMQLNAPSITFNPEDEEHHIASWRPENDDIDNTVWQFNGAQKATWAKDFNEYTLRDHIPVCGICGYLRDPEWCTECCGDEDQGPAKKAKTEE